MSKIPTAEELLIKYRRGDDAILSEDVKKLMIEFAKLHVKEALEAASEKAELELDDFGMLGTHEIINKESILTAYPLEKIK